jgi:hypothetical protein
LEYLKSIPNGIYKQYDVQISQEWLNQYEFQISSQNSRVDYIVEPEDSGVFNSNETGNSGNSSNNQSRNSQPQNNPCNEPKQPKPYSHTNQHVKVRIIALK